MKCGKVWCGGGGRFLAFTARPALVVQVPRNGPTELKAKAKWMDGNGNSERRKWAGDPMCGACVDTVQLRRFTPEPIFQHDLFTKRPEPRGVPVAPRVIDRVPSLVFSSC